MVSDENQLTPEMLTLEHRLRDLLKEWWKAQSNQEYEKAKAIGKQYHTVLESLFNLGYNMPLDIDDELPEHLMPKEYLERFPRSRFSLGEFEEHYDNLYKETGNEFYNLHRQRDKLDKSE